MKKQLQQLEQKMNLLIDNSGGTLGSTAAQVAIFTDIVDSAFLAVTINPPRTAGYLKLISIEQQKFLSKLFDKISSKFDCHSRHVFEYCKDGNIHLHGFIHMHQPGFIVGAINDIAKITLRELKRPVGKDNFYHEFLRYRCPAVCVQYFPPEREYEWIKYMEKLQPKKRVPQDIEDISCICQVPTCTSPNGVEQPEGLFDNARTKKRTEILK